MEGYFSVFASFFIMENATETKLRFGFVHEGWTRKTELRQEIPLVPQADLHKQDHWRGNKRAGHKADY